jgi:CDP-diacylglycerol--serine O-phosphatidyltransferase
MAERRIRRPRARRHVARESLRRGIYALPSLFTVLNLFFGFWAIIDAVNGHFERAAWLIILAGVLDGLDGRIARMMHATSDFGREYDSLADVVSFGVAPAILIYQWGLQETGRWGWTVAFLFLVAGSIRLARFNVRAQLADRRYFTGLAIPGGAGALTLMVLNDPEPVAHPHAIVAVWIFVLAIAVLMVSSIRYRSFKDFNLRRRWPATALFAVAVIIAAIAVSPVPVMSVLLGGYILSGPVEAAFRKLRPASPARPRLPASETNLVPPADSEHP